jgi:hypothetical protein
MLAGRKQVRLKRSKVRLSVQLKAMLAGRKQVRWKRSKVRLSVQLKAMLAGRNQARLKRSKVRLPVQLKAMLAGRKQVRLNSPFCTRNHTDASCFCLWAVSCISFHHACLLFKYQLRFVNGVVYK